MIGILRPRRREIVRTVESKPPVRPMAGVESHAGPDHPERPSVNHRPRLARPLTVLALAFVASVPALGAAAAPQLKRHSHLKMPWVVACEKLRRHHTHHPCAVRTHAPSHTPT